jgi:mono/diheme cytochrome c family protein
MNFIHLLPALGALLPRLSWQGLFRAALLLGLLLLGFAAQATGLQLIERGRYLVKTTGCNDCHTAGYGPSAGKIAEKDWLQGDTLGWQGPWGTTYATNLRLHFSRLSEAQWLSQARTMQARPPMPWFVLRDMSDADLKAIYGYIKAAGSAGQPAPASLPPGQPAQGPVVKFPG